MERSLIFLLVIVALCYFQTLLSDKGNKYLGWILPALTFIATIVLSVMWAEDFNIIKFLFTLLFTNIPTYILIIIYRVGRKRHSKTAKK